MLPAICVLFLSLGGVLASRSANQYIDSVLYSTLQNELRYQGLDPASLPNFNIQFKDKVMIIGTVNGLAEHTNGNMTGLARVRRFNECQGPAYSYGATYINCTIGFDLLQTSYKAQVKYGKLPKVNVKASGNITYVTAFIDVMSQPQNPTPTLRTFRFVQLGQPIVKYTGLGKQLDKFLKILNDGYKTHLTSQLYGNIAQRFQYALGRAVSQVPMPRM